jgi:hypothetical protein
MPALLNPKVVVAFLVALIGLATTGGKLYFTTLEKKEAVAQEKATDAYASNLKAENEQLANEVKSTGIAVVQPVNAIIKFRGSISREQISGLQLLFNKEKFPSPRPFRTSGIEATEITYFDEKDIKKAERISELTVDYFKGIECPIRVDQLAPEKQESEKYGKGYVVVSLYHKCG